MLKAVKVRIYPSKEQQSHLAQAFGCVRWIWNQSLLPCPKPTKRLGRVSLLSQ
ncbi:helix-turn-helix domain-containing protein [Nostoc sp.]|uniref:helix-turn-helix domain-containing protein n=1 Tax=Nostoc sp. TaxID=1180 RepID=UPI002FF45EF9